MSQPWKLIFNVNFILQYQNGAIMVVVYGEYNFEGHPDGIARAVEK